MTDNRKVTPYVSNSTTAPGASDTPPHKKRVLARGSISYLNLSEADLKGPSEDKPGAKEMEGSAKVENKKILTIKDRTR
jgi:hypothetical protein